MKLNRLLAVLCCLSLVTALLTPAAFAADDWKYEFQTEFYDFYDDGSGLAYKIVDNDNNEVMVGAYYERGTNANGNTAYKYHYSGEKIIPDTVEHENTTYTVVGIDQIAFQNSPVTSVTMPADSEAFQTIGTRAFQNCESLTGIEIPASVTRLGDGELDGSAFLGATALTSVTFAEDSKLEIVGSQTFCGCTNLSELTIPDSVTYIGGAVFANCESLKSVTIPAQAKLDASVFGWTANFTTPYYDSTANDGKGNVFFAEGSEYQIQNGILYDSDSLVTVLELQESVAVPEGIKYIGDDAFKMYGGDNTLKSITFPSTLESIGVDAFNGNKGLTSVTIPSGVTSLGANAFMNCSGLTSITINAKLTEIPEYAFSGCKSLTSVTIPEGVTSIGKAAFGAPSSQYTSCSALTSVTIPDSVTSIGEYAFGYDTALETIDLPKNLNALGASAFFKCTALKAVSIPEGVTEICEKTFANCNSLHTVVLPGTVNKVGRNAFLNSLATDSSVLVMAGSTPPDFDAAALGAGDKKNSTVTAVIPTAAKSAYTDDVCLLKDYIKEGSLYGLTMNDRTVKAAKAGETGNTLTFTADVPAGATLTVVSSAPGIATATVGGDGKTIKVTSVAQGETAVTAKITLDGIDFVLLEKTATVTVLAADKEPAVVVPAAPETKTDLPSASKDEIEVAEKVADALKPSEDSEGLTVSETTMSNAANNVAKQNTVTEEAGKAALIKNNILDAEDATVSIVVQPYLDIVIKDVDITGEEGSKTTALTLEITPMYQKVATTADLNKAAPDDIVVKKDNVESPNAVVMDSGKLTITEPVVVKVPLPENFTNADQLFVTHTKSSGRSYVYTGSVASNILTFTNPHGFSTFTMSASDPTAVKIGETSYTSLQDALDEAADDSTVIVLKDGLSGKITETKTITLRNTTDGKVTVTINGTAYTLAANETQAVSYTRPSGGGSSGGGGSATTYAVSVPNVTGGTVTVSSKNVSKGSTVTLTVKPNTGYELDKLTVTDKDGKEVNLTDKGDGRYSFTMPASKVTVNVLFTKTGTQPDTGFTDVPADAYYADAVKWAVDKGVTNGVTATAFAPDATCTRSQVVTFLWRAMGSPEPTTAANPFTDVSADAYYYQAVLWAVEKGITVGTSDTMFSPDATVTRGQTVTFQYRAAGSPTAIAGNTFTDVAADAYYANAVAWAAQENITSGTGDNQFSPNADCTRGQIVTFLYRYMGK